MTHMIMTLEYIENKFNANSFIFFTAVGMQSLLIKMTLKSIIIIVDEKTTKLLM